MQDTVRETYIVSERRFRPHEHVILRGPPSIATSAVGRSDKRFTHSVTPRRPTNVPMCIQIGRNGQVGRPICPTDLTIL